MYTDIRFENSFENFEKIFLRKSAGTALFSKGVYALSNEERVKIFEETLKISKEYFPHIDSRKYNNNIKIIWSENTVKSILEWGGNGRLCALNFADGYEMGGLVWQGVKTQEEDLCRSSNLYLALSALILLLFIAEMLYFLEMTI